MDKVFRPYCPCKDLNENSSNVCVVCGKLYDVDIETKGENDELCLCEYPTQRGINDKCVICQKSLKDYVTRKMGNIAATHCLCVTLTRTNPSNNNCEVCDKPKIFEKKYIFCDCTDPNVTNSEGECAICSKPRYFKMDYRSTRCSCDGKTKTDREEKCVVCGKPKVPDDTIKYCYNKKNCRYSDRRRLISTVNNRVHCPLRYINWCPWIGNIDGVDQHCRHDHPQNIFDGQATIRCIAHMVERDELDYFVTEFLVNVYNRLFKISFEINPNGLMKWSTAVQLRKDEKDEELQETYRFYVEFINSRHEHIYLDALCVKESAPLFANFATSIKYHKDYLQTFNDKANNILYRLFIINIPGNPQETLSNFYSNSRVRVLLNWSDCTLPEPSIYEDNCGCVKNFPENC